jgi:hypothetical protein
MNSKMIEQFSQNKNWNFALITTTKEYLVAAMDCEGASALTVLDLSFFDNASS